MMFGSRCRRRLEGVIEANGISFGYLSAGKAGERPIRHLYGADGGCLTVGTAGGLDGVPARLPPGSRAGLIEGAGHFLHLQRRVGSTPP